MKSALYIFERPSSEIVEWFEFAQRGESWLNSLNNKLSLVFSATLGLSELEPLERINLCMIQSPLIWQRMSVYLSMPDSLERSDNRIRSAFL